MLKASALYIVIIIALVIGVLCSSLIVSAYYFRTEYQKKYRYDQLKNNVNSGINIILASEDTSFLKDKTLSLFGAETDSVTLHRFFWGVYEVGISKSFIQKDTLFKVFSFASAIDSTKWAAIYLADADNPLSVSGKTLIRGNAFLPKAGITEANIEGKSYQGSKNLVIGKILKSQRTLPALNQNRLQQFEKLVTQKHLGDTSITRDSIKNSYLTETRFITLGKKTFTLSNIKLEGNVVILSDTSLTIDNSASLNNVMIFAKSITIKEGFVGTCQLFATDSLTVEHDCKFNYPSCLGILNYSSGNNRTSPTIKINSSTNFSGIIFTYEKTKSTVGATIELGKNVIISGQVYSQGTLRFTDAAKINGSIFTSSLVYRKDFKFFPNYLIDTRVDVKFLSPYYLASNLIPVVIKRKKVLQWLEAN